MNPLRTLVIKKQAAEQFLQGAGRKIRENVIQGQKDFKTRPNNSNYYGSINPFKGVFKK